VVAALSAAISIQTRLLLRQERRSVAVATLTNTATTLTRYVSIAALRTVPGFGKVSLRAVVTTSLTRVSKIFHPPLAEYRSGVSAETRPRPLGHYGRSMAAVLGENSHRAERRARTRLGRGEKRPLNFYEETALPKEPSLSPDLV
jgi:hypothetical protein